MIGDGECCEICFVFFRSGTKLHRQETRTEGLSSHVLSRYKSTVVG